VSPVVLRFLEWMGPQVAARQRRGPPRGAARVQSGVPDRPAPDPAVAWAPPAAREHQEVEHPAAAVKAPAPVSRLLEAAARRSLRQEAALRQIQVPLAPTRAPTRAPTQAPTRAPTQAPTRAPTRAPTQAPTQAPNRAWTRAGAPGPLAAAPAWALNPLQGDTTPPAAEEYQAAPTGQVPWAEHQAPWAALQPPVIRYPAGPFPGPVPGQIRPGPSPGPGLPDQQQPLLAPGLLAWEQAAAAWAGSGPALQAGPGPALIGGVLDRALRPPVGCPDEAPGFTEGAPVPGTQPGNPGAQGTPGARLLEAARLRQMLVEILRADALRHGLDLKER
jgi:hypothetical protein